MRLDPHRKFGQIACVQQAVIARDTCKSNLETRVQPPLGLLNACLACCACRAVTRGSYPFSANAGNGHFTYASYWLLLNPLAGSVAPVGHRNISEGFVTVRKSSVAPAGPLASDGSPSFTTSAGTLPGGPYQDCTEKLCATVQTSAKAVELIREKHSGQTPADEVGRVGLRKRVHKPVSWRCTVNSWHGQCGAKSCEQGQRTYSSRQKAAPTQTQGTCGVLWPAVYA